MRIRNNNPLDLEGADGEEITVTVSSSATKHLVSHTLNGDTGSSPSDNNTSHMTFLLDKASNDPCILTMLFTFSEGDGGNYAITVSGSAGGQVAHYSVTQFFGIPGDAISYTFDVI